MEKRKLPKGISGSGRKYPYLARVKKQYRDFSTIVVLVRGATIVQMTGKYLGSDTTIMDRFTPGSVSKTGELFSESCLTPFNKV